MNSARPIVIALARRPLVAGLIVFVLGLAWIVAVSVVMLRSAPAAAAG